MREADIGRFLRLLAHDLQNQVGAIDLNLQILPTLLDDGDPALPVLSPFMTRASGAAHELSDSLGDVQAFARAVSRDDEGLTFELSRVDLAQVVRDHAMMIAGSALQRKIEVRTSVGEPAFVLAEPDTVRRTLKILINEATRNLLPGSTLDLRVSSQPVPTIEVGTTSEGLFDDTRPTLSLYLVRELLRWSQGRLVMAGMSAQLMFQPG